MTDAPTHASATDASASDDAPSGAPRSRLATRLAFGLVLLGFSGCFALGAAEIAVRVAAPQQLIEIRPDLWQPLDTVGWGRRPDVSVVMNTGERTVTVRTDRDGFRVGAEGRRDAASQVLLMGDSFVEALQVEYEQSFGHLLERGLADSIGRSVVVRNAGIGGWSPNHYLLRTRALVQRDSFALVVVAVFVGNDAISRRVDHMPPRTPVERHRFRFPRALSGAEFRDALLAPINDGLEVRSHLYILFKNQLSTLRMRLGLTADYLPEVYRKDEAGADRWRLTAEVSRDLAAAAAARGVPTLFVLVPERFQVYDDEFRRYLAGFGVDSSLVDVDQPSRLLREAFEAEGLRVIDALPAFRAASDGERLYGTVDQHFSPRGHRVLADLLLREALPMVRR